ncbi:MAG: hypothetical protein KAI22_11020, partial [Gammaproteobacteria bacterium]|nr:hypothetical protein [Gammaproteobacteria bacterium]
PAHRIIRFQHHFRTPHHFFSNCSKGRFADIWKSTQICEEPKVIYLSKRSSRLNLAEKELFYYAATHSLA